MSAEGGSTVSSEDEQGALLHRRMEHSESEACVSSCSIDVEAGDGARQCRICLETEGADFIAPCHCRGSSKYVHRECLDQWRATKEGAAFSQCTTCKARYRMTVHPPSVRARAAKFGFLVARDTLAISSLTQLCVGLYALAAYLMDLLSGGALMQACGYQDRPQFYYHFGLFIFFFVVGVLGRQISRVQREHHTLVLLTLHQRPRRTRSRASRAVRHRNPAQVSTAVAAAAGHRSPIRTRQDVDQSEAVVSRPGSGGHDNGASTAVLTPGGGLGLSHAQQPLGNFRLREGADIESGGEMVMSPASPHLLSPHLDSTHIALLDREALSEQPSITPDTEEAAAAGLGREARSASVSARDQRVLMRFRQAVELTPQAIVKGCFVTFVVGFLAMGLIEAGVASGTLDGYFVGCMALVSVPSGVFYTLRLLKIIWDSHRCVLTKRRMTEEYVVESLDSEEDSEQLPEENETELKRLGLW